MERTFEVTDISSKFQHRETVNNDKDVTKSTHNLYRNEEMTKKKAKWINSQAKILLRDDIIRGVVHAKMVPRDVYQMREEYSEFKYENFRTNLKSLRDAVATSIHQMQMDSLFFGHDKSIMMNERQNTPRRLLWIESLAPSLLKQDIDEGLHELLTPTELYAYRVEYQAFPLQVFRNHIYQEVDTRAKRAHRYAKKKFRSQSRV